MKSSSDTFETPFLPTEIFIDKALNMLHDFNSS
jgi:hypothetical protein